MPEHPSTYACMHVLSVVICGLPATGGATDQHIPTDVPAECITFGPLRALLTQAGCLAGLQAGGARATHELQQPGVATSCSCLFMRRTMIAHLSLGQSLSCLVLLVAGETSVARLSPFETEQPD